MVEEYKINCLWVWYTYKGQTDKREKSTSEMTEITTTKRRWWP